MDWTPYIAGAGIGVLSWAAFLLSNKPLGCSTAFSRTSGMIERLFRGRKTDEKPYYRKFALVVDWEWMLVAGVVIGAFITSVIVGGFSFEWVPTLFGDTFGYDTGLRLAVAFAGGILMGLGSRWAGGCTSGHGISGTLQLAVSSWIAVVVFFLSGIVSAFLLYGVLW